MTTKERGAGCNIEYIQEGITLQINPYLRHPDQITKDPVALLGDVSQIYHQIALLSKDRPPYRFL